MKLRNTNSTTISQEDRDEAILQNLVLVKSLARQLRSRVPPCVTFDDLNSAGTIGLIEAVDRFDPSRGLKLRSFAQHRIWGAMLDFLRNEDPLSRNDRKYTAGSPNVSFDGIPGPALERFVGAPDRQFHDLAMRLDVSRARQSLSVRENLVITLLFDFGWENRRVAAKLAVNESRVSQIKQGALKKLASALSPADLPRAA